MYSMLFGNNSGGGANALLDGAPFLAELTHSLVPTRGTGTATFTRASTATVTNNDGYLVTALAGEARFVGARRVYNKVAGNSENLTNGSWTISNTTVVASAVTPPTGVGSVSLVTCSAGTLIKQIYNTVTSFTGTHIFSAYAKAGTHSVIQLLGGASSTVNFDLSAGTSATISGQSGTPSITSVGNGWYRCSMLFAAAANTTVNVLAENSLLSGRADATASTGNFYIGGAQLEDVTAQTTQTAGEYVSVGVLSAPYHGAGVDGVKCYDTDRSGNPISTSGSYPLVGYVPWEARTNLALQSQTFDSWTDSGATVTANSTVAPDGTTTADTITRVAGQGDARYVTPTLASNAVHAVSLWIKKGTSPSSLLALYDATATVYRLWVDITWSGTTPVFTFIKGSLVRLVEWVNGLWRVEFLTETVVAANTHRLYLYPGRAGSANGETVIAWGAQLELGPFASSYIATTTTAVTGNVDVESVSTSGNIAAAAGSIYLEYTPTHTPSGTIALWGTYVDASNYTAILHDATNLIFRKRIAGVNYDATIANAFVAGTTYKACATWGAAGTSITLNGTEGTPHANTTAAQIAATMQWGADGNGGSQPFMALKYGYIGQRQLSASELLAITS